MQDSPSGKMFWRSTEYDQAYWDAYVAARPHYPSQVYDRIIEYYRTHNPKHSGDCTAHDAGTGPGQMAGELCKYFNHVVGSDVNDTHTAAAAVRLSHLKSQLTWSNASLEELGDSFLKASTNLVTIAQALALTDKPRVLESTAKLLAPNGTLAVIQYGQPHFYDDRMAASHQQIIYDILTGIVAGPLRNANEFQLAFWKRAADTVSTQFDNVHFPEETWADVRRFKWNPQLQMSAFAEEDVPFKFDAKSAVNDENEKIIVEDEPLFWSERWSYEELVAFFECQLPNIDALKADKEIWDPVDAKYRELRTAMGGTKHTIYFPAVLLLATRK